MTKNGNDHLTSSFNFVFDIKGLSSTNGYGLLASFVPMDFDYPIRSKTENRLIHLALRWGVKNCPFG